MTAVVIVAALAAGFFVGLVFRRVLCEADPEIVEVESATVDLKSHVLVELNDARAELDHDRVRVLTYVHNALSDL